MYGLMALSVLLWAVLFCTGMLLWWSVSRPGAPRREAPRRDTLPRRTGPPRHRRHA